MKKMHSILIVLLLNLSIGFAQDNLRILEGLSIESEILGQAVKYSIILPEEYHTTKKSYPVVYLLHGLGDDESSWLEYGRVNQYTDGAVKQGEIQPMIYVMPQGFRNYYVNDYAGTFLYEDMFINELVPFIDKEYRTIPDKDHRATMGYSMGGYGALILPLKHPEVFTVSVPLSISVRTDEQYKTEDASGWDDQWGRLFGGVGEMGEKRITDYYKQHSPFHIFKESDLTRFSDLKLYIDNGDDEYTLCRSNEELHMLLRDRNFQHEFRVRDGGHEFSYWREALPNGLRFISDAFDGKKYRGDIKTEENAVKSSVDIKIIKEGQYEVVLPTEYNISNRLYPVVFFIGDFQSQEKREIIEKVQYEIESDRLAPMISAFINEDEQGLLKTIIPDIERNYRARSGYRFRALIGYNKGGLKALEYALNPEVFTSCVVFDTPLDCNSIKQAFSEHKKALKRTWYFINITADNPNYQANGCAHVFLREEDVYHEYRVRESTGRETNDLSGLSEALRFTQRKIHR